MQYNFRTTAIEKDTAFSGNTEKDTVSFRKKGGALMEKCLERRVRCKRLPGVEERETFLWWWGGQEYLLS